MFTVVDDALRSSSTCVMSCLVTPCPSITILDSIVKATLFARSSRDLPLSTIARASGALVLVDEELGGAGTEIGGVGGASP